MMTFKDRYLAGEVEFEAIDDYVEEWNGSDGSPYSGPVSGA